MPEQFSSHNDPELRSDYRFSFGQLLFGVALVGIVFGASSGQTSGSFLLGVPLIIGVLTYFRAKSSAVRSQRRVIVCFSIGLTIFSISIACLAGFVRAEGDAASLFAPLYFLLFLLPAVIGLALAFSTFR